VQVGAQSHADRYAYLPLLGPTFGVVLGVRALVGAPAARRALFALGLLAAGAYAAVTFVQIRYWRDSRALCERALAVTERNHVAHQVLALELQRDGELLAALEHYRATLALAPYQHDAHGTLGAGYMQLGRRDEALAEYREALRLRPDFLDARLNWGLLLELEGDFAGALAQYELATRTHPEAGAAWSKRGDALLALGRAAEARDAFRAALERAPDAPDAPGTLAGLGSSLGELGEEDAALAHLARALHRAPRHARAVHATAWIHATSRDPRRRDPERALALLATCGDSGWPHLRTVAAALAAAGRFTDARRAAAEASAAAPAPLWPALKAERETYAAGRALGE
jgi:tetratricopeptide (TPR) repeat protein